MDGETRIFDSPVFLLFFLFFFPPLLLAKLLDASLSRVVGKKKPTRKMWKTTKSLWNVPAQFLLPPLCFSQRKTTVIIVLCVWMVRSAEQAASGVFLVPHDWDADEVGKMEMVSSPRSPLRTHILQ